MDDLLDLKHDVADALYCLERALQRAGNLCTCPEDGTDIGWKEAEESYRRLDYCLSSLKVALDPLAPAISEEEARQQDMEDRWDAQRY
jgi:hypothetical protein